MASLPAAFRVLQSNPSPIKMARLAASPVKSMALWLPILTLLTSSMLVWADNNPQRVISADASVTGIIMALGQAHRLVAIDASSEPLAARDGLPRVGYHRALSAEGLLGLAPDLIVGSEQMGPAPALATAARSGAKVVTLPYPGDAQTLRSNLEKVAMHLGVSPGDSLAKLDKQMQRLNQQAANQYSATFLLHDQSGALRLAGRATGGGGFVNLLGARNLADFAGYRAISQEGLLALQPDLILIAQTQGGGLQAVLERYPLLRFSPAVSNGRIYSVDSRMLVAGLSLAAVGEASRLLGEISPAVVHSAAP